jgi:hypothetical protein
VLQVASISQLTVNRLSRQFQILDIFQPYRTPRPVTGIALLSLRFIHFVVCISSRTVFCLSEECYFVRLTLGP